MTAQRAAAQHTWPKPTLPCSTSGIKLSQRADELAALMERQKGLLATRFRPLLPTVDRVQVRGQRLGEVAF